MAPIPNQFEAPTAFSNVVLIVDGKKLHVNKDVRFCLFTSKNISKN